MVSEVSKALKTYEALPPAGKRLFREELGLVRPQQASKRKRSTIQKGNKVVLNARTAEVPTIRRRAKALDTIFSVAEQPTA